MTTHIDLETYSDIDLRKVGLYRYAEDPSTRVTLLGYAFDDEPVQVVDLYHGERLPWRLAERLADPREPLCAHNAQFERVLMRYAMGRDLPPERWRCTAVWARSLALPAGLDAISKVVGTKARKLDGERKLITALCTPKKGGIAKNIHLWPQFIEYNKADVEVEREVGAKLARFSMPQRERRLWFIDQKINDRGLPIDRAFVERCAATAEANADAVTDEVKLRTDMANPGSRNQWLAWLRSEKVDAEDLKAGTVDRLRTDTDIDEDIRDLLDLRRELAATSLSKLDKLKDATCRDGRLRGTLTFLGAPRTGRWSGKLFQPQNLPRGVLKESEILPARALAEAGDVGSIRMLWGEVSPVLASLIRTAIAAPPGRKLVCADLASIETVMLGWAAECPGILRVFEEGRDAYKDFGSRYLFHVPYDQITKAQRSLSKPAVLGCGYGMGARGLQSYARGFGVELALNESGRHVRAYRGAYPEVVTFWDAVEQAAFAAVETGLAQRVGVFGFRKVGPFLFIDLPSGRSLSYYRPYVAEGRYGRELRYLSGAEYGNRIWLSSYGPKLCIGRGTPVLTGRGWVAIEDVAATDVVWDGVEWVNTSGSVFNGVRRTMVAYGVRMTPDHEVLTEAGWRRADETTGLDRAEVPLPDGCTIHGRQALGVPLRLREPDGATNESGEAQDHPGEVVRVHAGAPDQLLTNDPRDDQTPCVRGLEVDGGPLHTTYASSVASIRRAWHYIGAGVGRFIRGVLGRHGADVPEGPVSGPGRQQRRIHNCELPLGIPASAGTQYSQQSHDRYPQRADADGRSGGDLRDRVHYVGIPRDRRDPDGPPVRPAERTESVYDVLNCGPRNRFTVAGADGRALLVHNCENIVQAIARDKLADGLVNAHEAGLDVFLHVHDEVVCEADENDTAAFPKLIECMTRPSPWCADAPITAAGWEGRLYRKD